jgi:hypothetical protein
MIDPSNPTDKISSALPLGDEKKAVSSTPSNSFNSYMQKITPQSEETRVQSPFELVQNQSPLATGTTLDSLLNQVRSTHGMLGDISSNLQQPKLRLTENERSQMQSWLSKANSQLRTANEKLGIETKAPSNSATGGILGKFLDMIQDGQSNLKSAQSQLQDIQKTGDQMRPTDFLAIQIKVSHAQQQIEFCSMMLAKSVENIKTIMNIQI